jgi:thiol:disulfide interchange protein DsbA
MKRRELTAAGAALATMAGWSSSVALAQGPALAVTDGKDYVTLSKVAPTDAPKGQVEVIEFFGYFCPHCNAFEPTLEQWVKKLPPYIAFKRVPVAFGPKAEAMQRLYYTLEAMGKVEAYHREVFAAVHVKRADLTTVKGVMDWAKSSGIDMKAFTQNFDSFGVANKLIRAKQLVNAYQVGGVPSFGVHGRYYTDGELSKNNDRALQVVEALAVQLKKTV